MTIEDFKYRKRIVRLEPSPFIKPVVKLKMSQTKTNSAGQPLVDPDGNVKKVDIDVNEVVQIPGTAKMFSAALTASGLRTGLDMLVENPYKDESVYFPDWGEQVLKGKDKVLLQHILEYKHKQTFNYYTGSLFDRIEPSTKVSELPFYLTPQSKVLLDGGIKLLDLSNPIHEVNYYMLRQHPEVANSYNQLEEGRNQKAIYYISTFEENDDRKTVKIKMESKAGSILTELADFPDIIIMFAKALECEDKILNVSRALNYIHSFYHTTDGSDIEHTKYSIFMKYYELYEDPNRRPRFFAAAKLQDALNTSVIREREGKYYWIKPEIDNSPIRTFEWATKEKVIDFLTGPEYEEEVALLDSIVESKKNLNSVY